jgi:hypothetical protein
MVTQLDNWTRKDLEFANRSSTGAMIMQFTSRLVKAAKRRLSYDRRQKLRRLQRRLLAPYIARQARDPTNLDALARLYGTDKASDRHGYTRFYQRHFGPHRDVVESVLEIGVGGTTSNEGYETSAGGQSLRMWSDYFPNATIFGVDIHAKDIKAPRVVFEQGDQSDPGFLRELGERYGPFDIIIDDGSHIGRHIEASFHGLWNRLKPGGWYAIEDLGVAYHPLYEGGPPGTPGTAASLIKALVDSTLQRHEDEVGTSSFDPPIAAMHVYGEIVFLEKASAY